MSVREPNLRMAEALGPAKGYTVALERRLAETENALLQLLSTINDESLELAFSESFQLSRGGGCGFPTSDAGVPGGSKKASSVAYWEKFPLKTAQDIKCWASVASVACFETKEDAGHMSGPRSLAAHVLEDSARAPLGEAQDTMRPMSESFVESIAYAIDPIQNYNGPGTPELAPPTEASVVEEQDLGPGPSSGERQTSYDMGNARRNQEEERVDLPLEFREQFIW
ncbi:hypothetical protein G7046_g5974 [Stylonectria norvegica]|nr:hypothetical protein G7046_g5974 [Stylonectria norvegica]